MRKFKMISSEKVVLFFASSFTLMTLLFVACRQDQSINPLSINNNSTNSTYAVKNSARQYYDKALVDLKQQNIESAKTDAHFTALDITPDWNAAIVHNKGNKTFVEVPVTFAKGGVLATSETSNPTKFNAQNDIPIPARLIIIQSQDGSFDANIMLQQSESPYSNGVVPEFNLFKKINNFSGYEYNYHLDGSFNKGWKHKDGQIVGTFVLPTNDLRSQPISLRKLCDVFYSYDLNTGEVIRIIFVSCMPDLVIETTGGGGYSGGGYGTANTSNNNSSYTVVTNMCASAIRDGFNISNYEFGPWTTGSSDPCWANTLVHGTTAEFKDLQVPTANPQGIDIRSFDIGITARANITFNNSRIGNMVATAYNNIVNTYTGASTSDAFLGAWRSEFNRLYGANYCMSFEIHLSVANPANNPGVAVQNRSSTCN